MARGRLRKRDAGPRSGGDAEVDGPASSVESSGDEAPEELSKEAGQEAFQAEVERQRAAREAYVYQHSPVAAVATAGNCAIAVPRPSGWSGSAAPPSACVSGLNPSGSVRPRKTHSLRSCSRKRRRRRADWGAGRRQGRRTRNTGMSARRRGRCRPHPAQPLTEMACRAVASRACAAVRPMGPWQGGGARGGPRAAQGPAHAFQGQDPGQGCKKVRLPCPRVWMAPRRLTPASTDWATCSQAGVSRGARRGGGGAGHARVWRGAGGPVL